MREQRAISADVAFRLGKYFEMTPQFWMNRQADYDLRPAAASAPRTRSNPGQRLEVKRAKSEPACLAHGVG